MAKTFTQYVNEGKADISKELEQLMFGLNPKNFIKEAEGIKDKSWYWANKPNYLIWQDQNGYGGSDSYIKGSLMDLFRNYRYNGEMMSTKMKEYIDKTLPLKGFICPDFEREYEFIQDGEKHTFKVEIPDKSKIEKLVNYEIEKGANSKIEKVFKKGSIIFDPYDLARNLFATDYIKGQIDGKGSFSFKTFRNRKKLSPSSIITLKDLQDKFAQLLKLPLDAVYEQSKYRELVTLVMVDKIIGDNFVKGDRALVQQMKDELLSVTKGDEAAEILNRYNFSNIPSANILDELIRSENFSYSESRPDGYGHTTGTIWKINFENRSITSQGWSSDD